MTPGRHLTRRVVRYEHGTATVLADNFGGKKLNSPNDVVAHPDGSYWFTDPPYGGQLYEGEPDVAGGKGDMSVFDVGTDNKLSDQKRFSDFMVDGVKCGPDGVRCDVNGNVWASSNAGRAVGYSGVTIWNPDGKLIGRIRLPEVCGNICTRRLLHAAQSWLWLDCRGCSRLCAPMRMRGVSATAARVTTRRTRHPRSSRSASDRRSGPCGRSRHWARRGDAKSASPADRPAR